MKSIFKVILVCFLFIKYSNADIGDFYTCKSEIAFEVNHNKINLMDEQKIKFKLNKDNVTLKGNDYFGNNNNEISVDTTLASLERFHGYLRPSVTIDYKEGSLIFMHGHNYSDDEVASGVIIIAKCSIDER